MQKPLPVCKCIKNRDLRLFFLKVKILNRLYLRFNRMSAYIKRIHLQSIKQKKPLKATFFKL